MSRKLALLWGALATAPLLYKCLYVVAALNTVAPGGVATPEDIARLQRLHAVEIAMNVLALGLVVSFLVYVFRSEHVPSNRKALWAVVLFLGNILAMPVFWYLCVWRPVTERDDRSE
jgi:hypothetical protein